MNWKYRQPVEIHFGVDAVKSLYDHIEKRGYTRGVIVTSPSFLKNGVVANIMSSTFGTIVESYSDVAPNPDVCQVDACAKIVRDVKCDFIVALGGGSVIDCAKLVSLIGNANLSARDYIEGCRQIDLPNIPLIAIPTTAGTGSEVTSVAVISDHEKGTKTPLASDKMFPVMAIVDPTLTYSMPSRLTACSGVDALCHAIEAYWSRNHQPICDGFAVKAASMVLQNIEAATLNNDIDARNKMCEASLVAGLAFAIPKTSSAHACSYPLTNILGIPHGEACGLTIDWWIRFNASKGDKRTVEFANALGFDSAVELAIRIGEIKSNLGLRTNLKSLNLTHENVAQVMAACMHPNMKNNPIEVTEYDIKQLFDYLL